MLGLPRAHDDVWKDLFGTGAKPLPDRAAYPDKQTHLAALADAHARLADAVANATPESLAQPAPERLRRLFPTLGHMIAGLMSAHYASHNGQLSAWRRAMGYPSAF